MKNKFIKAMMCVLVVTLLSMCDLTKAYAINVAEWSPSRGEATNEEYLAALPTTNVKALGPTAHHGRSFIGETFTGFTSEFCIEKDTNNSKYKELKATTDNLTKDCKTEREKAAKICSWVYDYIDYQYGLGAKAEISQVYRILEQKKGNCEAYTLLTNYMLFLCNIPTATVTDMTHMWSAAFVDGKWIYLDPTGRITGGVSSGHTALEMTFAYDGLVYSIANPSDGAYVTGIAKSDEDIKNLKTFIIPENSYMKGIYKDAFRGKYEVKAKPNTLGANYIKEYNSCTWTEGGYVKGNSTHTNETVYEGNFIITKCKYCGEIESKVYNPNAGTEIKPSYKLGDANGDGVIDALDAREVLKYCVGKANFTANQKLAADTNKDGVADALDAREILKYCVGKITKF